MLYIKWKQSVIWNVSSIRYDLWFMIFDLKRGIKTILDKFIIPHTPRCFYIRHNRVTTYPHEPHSICNYIHNTTNYCRMNELELNGLCQQKIFTSSQWCSISWNSNSGRCSSRGRRDKTKTQKNLADVNQHFTWPGQLDPVRLPSESAVVVWWGASALTLQWLTVVYCAHLQLDKIVLNVSWTRKFSHTSFFLPLCTKNALGLACP